MYSTVLIERVYRLKDSVRAIATVRVGTVKEGMHAIIQGKPVKITSIITDNKRVKAAKAESSIGLVFDNSFELIEQAKDKTLKFEYPMHKNILDSIINLFRKNN